MVKKSVDYKKDFTSTFQDSMNIYTKLLALLKSSNKFTDIEKKEIMRLSQEGSLKLETLSFTVVDKAFPELEGVQQSLIQQRKQSLRQEAINLANSVKIGIFNKNLVIGSVNRILGSLQDIEEDIQGTDSGFWGKIKRVLGF